MGEVLFGPSIGLESLSKDGFSPANYLKNQGLDLLEYSFGQGFRMPLEKAQKIGKDFAAAGVEMSIHAPFFINFANPDPEMLGKSLAYIKTGIRFMNAFGAKRMVFHSGSCGTQKREDAIKLMTSRFLDFMPEIEGELGPDMFICPETMGKSMQIGTWKEIIDLCTISEKLLPTFDFGHINALTQGGLKTADDFQKIVDYSFEKLGEKRTRMAHVHFSKVQYGAKGEIRHLTFEDQIFGPNFEPLCEVLVKNNLSFHIISESAGTQVEDSVTMKRIYKNFKK